MLSRIKHPYKRNRKAIASMRRRYCERCGRETDIEPHHIFTIGSGGQDNRENLLQLCSECHISVHMGGIAREELLKIVARREGISTDEAYRRDRRAMGWEV